jgi:hypothetical protein
MPPDNIYRQSDKKTLLTDISNKSAEIDSHILWLQIVGIKVNVRNSDKHKRDKIFEKAFGGTADTRLRMQMNYDLAQMRGQAGRITVERLTP